MVRSKRANTSKKSNNVICYTGIGSKKNGIHNKKEFVKVMNTNFNKECSRFVRRKKCPSCKKYSKMALKYQKKIRNNINFKKQTFKNLIDKCHLCKNSNLIPCNFKQYIEFSGAEKGRC